MIAKTSKGYVVKSESGKNLSKPYPTKQQAQKDFNRYIVSQKEITK